MKATTIIASAVIGVFLGTTIGIAQAQETKPAPKPVKCTVEVLSQGSGTVKFCR